MHQPVLAIRNSDEDNLLDGHRQAVPAWAAAGGDIIMGGHIHLPYVRSLRTTFGALPRDIWTVQAGTAVSSRIREGITNSVNVIRCDGERSPRRCAVERWDYVPTLSRFEQHSSQELTFARPSRDSLVRRRFCSHFSSDLLTSAVGATRLPTTAAGRAATRQAGNSAPAR